MPPRASTTKAASPYSTWVPTEIYAYTGTIAIPLNRGSTVTKVGNKETHQCPAVPMRRSRVRTTVYLLLTAVAVVTTSLIALRTRYRAHPDGHYQVDAFHFVEERW